MKVNPDPHKDGFEVQPTNNVTAELDTFEIAKNAAGRLDIMDFEMDAIRVYVGQEGLEKIDLDGEEHGIYATLLRSIQHLSHEWRIHESAKNALEEGRVLISVLTDGSDEQIDQVVEVLKNFEATRIVFWGELSTQEF